MYVCHIHILTMPCLSQAQEYSDWILVVKGHADFTKHHYDNEIPLSTSPQYSQNTMISSNLDSTLGLYNKPFCSHHSKIHSENNINVWALDKQGCDVMN